MDIIAEEEAKVCKKIDSLLPDMMRFGIFKDARFLRERVAALTVERDAARAIAAINLSDINLAPLHASELPEIKCLATALRSHVRSRGGPTVQRQNGAWTMMLEAADALDTFSSLGYEIARMRMVAQVIFNIIEQSIKR